jgi:hypothetical protein
MKNRYSRSGFAMLVAVTAGLFLASNAHAQKPSAGSSTATPRTADGKPDLSGMWGGGRGGGGGDADAGAGQVDEGDITTNVASRRCAPNEVGCNDQTNQTVDGEFTGRLGANRPLYKPEFWDKVQNLDRDTNSKDPIFQCQSLGVPRLGAPRKIIQTAKEVVLFYGAEYRIIPTDGRKHDPVRALDVTYNGDSVGHWDGDTLVIDSVAFNDITWLDKGGYFHSDLMHVIEKIHRDGDTLTYEVTVDDPTVLLQPWVMTPRSMKVNNDPNATIREPDPCRDVDQANMVSRVRH